MKSLATERYGTNTLIPQFDVFERHAELLQKRGHVRGNFVIVKPKFMSKPLGKFVALTPCRPSESDALGARERVYAFSKSGLGGKDCLRHGLRDAHHIINTNVGGRGTEKKGAVAGAAKNERILGWYGEKGGCRLRFGRDGRGDLVPSGDCGICRATKPRKPCEANSVSSAIAERLNGRRESLDSWRLRSNLEEMRGCLGGYLEERFRYFARGEPLNSTSREKIDRRWDACRSAISPRNLDLITPSPQHDIGKRTTMSCSLESVSPPPGLPFGLPVLARHYWTKRRPRK